LSFLGFEKFMKHVGSNACYEMYEECLYSAFKLPYEFSNVTPG